MKRFVFALGLAFLTQVGIGMMPQHQNVQNNIKMNTYDFRTFQGVVSINDEYALVKDQCNSIRVMGLNANGQLKELNDGEQMAALFALNNAWSILHGNVGFQFTNLNAPEQTTLLINALVGEGIFRWNESSLLLQQQYGCYLPMSCFKEYILDLRNTWTPRNLNYSCTAEKDANGHVHLVIWDRKANQYRLASLVELFNTKNVLEGQLQQNGIVLPPLKGESVSERIVKAIEALELEWKRIRNIAEVKHVTPLNGTYVVADNEVMRYWENQLSPINNDEKPAVYDLLQRTLANANTATQGTRKSADKITQAVEGLKNITGEGYETVFRKEQQQIQIELQQSDLYIPEPLVGTYFNSYMIDLLDGWSSGHNTYTLEGGINGKIYLMMRNRKVGKYRYATVEEQICVLDELNKKSARQGKKIVQRSSQTSLIDRILNTATALGKRWGHSDVYIPESLVGTYFNSYIIDLLGEWFSGDDTYTLERDIDGNVYLVVWNKNVKKYRYATVEEQIYVLDELNKKLAQQGKKTVQRSSQTSLIEQILNAAIALGRRWEQN